MSARYRAWIPVALVLVCGCTAISQTAAQRTDGKEIKGVTFENEYVACVVGEDGKVRSFSDKSQNKEYVPTGLVRAMMTVSQVSHGAPRDGGKPHNSSSVTFRKDTGEMTVGFEDSGVTARFQVRTRPHYLTFELTGLTGNEVTAISLCELILDIHGIVGEVIAVARDERFAAGVQAMNIKMEAAAGKQPQGSILIVKDTTLYGPLVGAKFALFGCPTEKILDTIGEIEVNEGLPHPIFSAHRQAGQPALRQAGLPAYGQKKHMLAGKWGKVSPEATKSYLVISYSEQNIDEVLKYAQAGGFSYIYHPGPFETWGHWPLRKSEFPHGYAGLKAIVQKANGQGIKVGLHHLSGGITTNDAYVTPVPDPRLEKYGTATLAADADVQATSVSVRDARGRFGATKIVQIDDELIQYGNSSGENPVQLTGCVRGLYKTHAAAHKAGATVSTLVVNSYKGFVPEPDSTLLDEMAERMAGIFNECGLNQISFDGWEWHGYNKKHYGMNKYLDAVMRRCKMEVIADASGVTHYGWHWFTRMNWGELTQSARVDVDEYRSRNCAMFERNLMPKALGWWRLGLAGPDWEATPLDDIEYLLAKAAGYGGCHAMTTSLEELKRHGLTEKVLATVRAWDSARYAGAFSEDRKTRLRRPGADFHLESIAEGKWTLTPIAFSPKYWSRGATNKSGQEQPSFSSAGALRPGNRCEFDNPFPEQPLRFDLRALPAFDYESKENITLLPPSGSDLMREPSLRKEAPTIRVTPAPSLHGERALELTAKYDGDKPSYVTRLVYHFPKPLNLVQHRGVGMWVRGDGKGELLFVELISAQGSVRPYYVPIDFTGERYIELPSGETSLSRYYDYDWNNWTGFASWWVTLKGFNYTKVASMTVGFNRIPPKTGVSCAVAGVKALREMNSPLVNPRFTVGGRTVTFPVSLQPQQYLVCEGDGKGLVYDSTWHLLKTIIVGDLPRFSPGRQTVEVGWGSSGGPAPWGRVRLKAVGAGEPVGEGN